MAVILGTYAAIYGFDRVSVRDALIAAHNAGVTVRIATDDDTYADSDFQPHFSELEDAGIPVVNDNRSSLKGTLLAAK